MSLISHCLNSDSNERPSFNVLLVLMMDMKDEHKAITQSHNLAGELMRKSKAEISDIMSGFGEESFMNEDLDGSQQDSSSSSRSRSKSWSKSRSRSRSTSQSHSESAADTDNRSENIEDQKTGNFTFLWPNYIILDCLIRIKFLVADEQIESFFGELTERLATLKKSIKSDKEADAGVGEKDKEQLIFEIEAKILDHFLNE